MRIDGFDAPIDLVATLTIDDELIHIDFAGTSGVSKYGINCPLCYADAYTSFGVKCIVAPQLANNAAVLARIRVTAPEGTITNAPFPAPVTGRSVIGQMLPDVVFGCFAKAMPDAAPAEGTAASWSLRIAAGPGITGREGIGLHVAQLSERRDGRASGPRRGFRDAFSIRRQGDRNRNHRGLEPTRHLAEGASPGFGRRRQAPWWSRSDHGSRQSRERAFRPLCPFRACRFSGPRPPWRP